MNRDDNLCWFHGKLSRENAEEIIRQGGNDDGLFLVRESNTAVGDFVLTLLYQQEVCHYQIRRHGEDAIFSIDDKVQILHGLETLVDFYRQGANGLITKLIRHVIKDPPPNDSRSHGQGNLLHRATQNNNLKVVSALLQSSYSNFDAKNQLGQTALHLAALYCDEEILKLFLKTGFNVNCMDTDGYMPLHYACRNKSASFIRILIDAHANVQGRNIKNGYVPLHEAARHGNLDAVKELLAINVPLLPRTSSGEFPIDLAKETGQDAVVNYLNNYKTLPATTYQSQWYHGTLARKEAIDSVSEYAEKLEKNLRLSQAITKTDDLNANNCINFGTNNSNDALTSNANSISNDIDTSGCFLVRYSSNKNKGSGYVLTLLCNKIIKNFIISQANKYLYIDDGPYLPSLEHLVEHFMRFSDGLPVSLKYPVTPQPKPPLPLCSTMPRSKPKKSFDTLLTPTTQYNQMSREELFRKHSLEIQQTNDHEKFNTQTMLKKQKKENTSSVFNTIIKSPKKAILIDSLRKNKTKTKSPSNDDKKEKISEEEVLKKTEPLLKTLSFSTDFQKLNLGQVTNDGEQLSLTSPTSPLMADDFYNVPKNNSAIAAVNDIETITAAAMATKTTTTNGNDDNDDDNDNNDNNNDEDNIENKTEAEVEYFTRSDVDIEMERISRTLENFDNHPSKFNVNSNGYIPTVDVRVFLDPFAGEFTQELLDAQSAELRELSNFPERLESMISNVSTESDLVRFLKRQASNASNITTMSEQINSAQNTPLTPSTKLRYFIPREFIELDCKIGEGEFGAVYKGCLKRHHLNTNGGQSEIRHDVAIKTLRDELCRTNKQEFLREASVMIRLHHHCIVQLIGISKGDTLMMIQEIAPLGSLLNYILDNREKINPNYELKIWASQIACGMQYLESQHFVHRDLAARNILIATRNQVKISDFGLSRALNSGNECYQATQGGKWPIKWYAPESYNNGLFSHASDVWSFGVTLWEMFSMGDPPYGEKRGVEAMEFIEKGHRLSQPLLCPPHVYDIMKNCWNYKPKDRPTFHYLTEFFAKDPSYQNIMELIRTDHIA